MTCFQVGKGKKEMFRVNQPWNQKKSKCFFCIIFFIIIVKMSEFQSAAATLQKSSVLKPFLSLGTFETFMSIWRNLNVQNNNIFSIFREPLKELTEPPGSTESGLKNTDQKERNNIWLVVSRTTLQKIVFDSSAERDHHRHDRTS